MLSPSSDINPCHSLFFWSGSFAVQYGDHFRSGIICGPIWGSFAVLGSFADPYSSVSWGAAQKSRKLSFLTPIFSLADFRAAPQPTERLEEAKITQIHIVVTQRNTKDGFVNFISWFRHYLSTESLSSNSIYTLTFFSKYHLYLFKH